MARPVLLVGREDELSRLVGALGGDTRLVLVTGDAGVGKTRLVAEGTARATAAGTVMVRGECLPVAGTLPLLPAAFALGELASLDGGRLMEAALGAAPGFVRAEVARLVPQLGPADGPGPDGPGGGWQRERLFAGVMHLLDAVAEGSAAGVGLVVEDVHWADSETLDFLTFVSAWPGVVRVVVTCRSDEAPVAPQVARWLAQARGAAATEEITLGPLSRAGVAGQAAALAGRPVPPALADELFTRAEGNPFFTEQLLAAALATGAAKGRPQVPAGLPPRLAGLLAARTGRCGGDARMVLDALVVAGRPLGEHLLGDITGLDPDVVRGGVRELAAARLLADDTTPGGGHRPRHALLAEAVAAGLLPGERAGLHERTARALAAAGDQALAAEVAGHWQAAGNPAGELPARLAAGAAAERVFGYAQAAVHWLRAIELCQAQSGIADAAGVDLPRMYVRAIDALQLAGDSAGAATVAEEACRRFARHSDPVTAGVVCHRAAYWRAVESPAAGLALIEEALRLFGQAPPCAEQASAWCDYGAHFLYLFQDRLRDGEAALHRALQIAEAAGATTLIPDILARLAGLVFDLGQAEEGFAFLQRGWALAQASGNDHQLLWLAVIESDTLYKMGKFQGSAEVALRGLQAARQVGLAGSFRASLLAANAAEALIARGRTAEAAALIDPLTTGPPDRDHWAEHDFRAEIDLLRGDITGAAHRQQQNKACAGERADIIDHARGTAEQVVELALWAGRPGDAVEEAQRILAMFTTSDLAVHSGRLLIAGLRGCADLAEQARARRDGPAADAALAAADGLDAWVDQMAGVPFADHPLAATIPAHRATWAAEHTRLAGSSDPGAWANAAKLWQDLDCAHRAGYTWWRQAQAQLDAGQPPTAAAAALRAAAAAADGHVPLLAQVRALAERTRIPLRPPAPATPEMPAATAAPYGLTMRELAVLRLVAAGRSNAQIGAELYISRATASVHVTSILRKLGVTNRVQAAAMAERAGLLDTRPLAPPRAD